MAAMPLTSTRTRKRIQRARSKRQREATVRTPLRNQRFFRFDASIRIAGVGAWHGNITRITGIEASRTTRKGEARSRHNSRLGVWTEDLWILQSPLSEDAPLDAQIQWLWRTIEPHRNYFEALMAQATWADLCLGCLSESIYPFFSVNADALEITRALPLDLSFNFTVT